MSEENKVYQINETASIGDPGPLGLACFALTTFCLSVVNAGLVDKAAGGMVLMLALAYGGSAQILAGMWEFKKNNAFGATAFTSYGAFWISLALYELGAGHGWIEATAAGTTLFLIAWTIFTAYMWIGSFALNNGLVAVFTLLIITFLLLVIGSTGYESIHKLGGYFGIATAFAAWYTSAAVLLNGVYKKTILPIGPRNK